MCVCVSVEVSQSAGGRGGDRVCVCVSVEASQPAGGRGGDRVCVCVCQLKCLSQLEDVVVTSCVCVCVCVS